MTGGPRPELEQDGQATQADDPGRPPGPPGSGTFSLEGRPAPGLYLVAWLLSGGGLAVAFVAGLAQPGVRAVLLLAGLILLCGGLAAGAGYQIMSRHSRPASAYRGPSPVIVFGVLFVAANAVGLVMAAAGVGDLQTAPGFGLGAGILFIGYLLAVWLFVVRSGALSWSEMGLPRVGLSGHLGSMALGVAVMIPVTVSALIVGGIVAQVVDAQPPQVVPIPERAAEALIVALGAALLVPIGEELFFRGFALTAWLRDKGPRVALVWSSVFFTLVHIANITAGFEDGARQALVQSAVIFPLGLVLGGLFLLRGLPAAIAGHVTYNGILLALLMIAERVTRAVPG